jgi:hypothetical protein
MERVSCLQQKGNMSDEFSKDACEWSREAGGKQTLQ